MTVVHIALASIKGQRSTVCATNLQAQVQVLAVLEPDVVVSVDAEGHILQWGSASGAAAWHLPIQQWALPTHISLLCPRSGSMPLAVCCTITCSHLQCEQHHRFELMLSEQCRQVPGLSHAIL